MRGQGRFDRAATAAVYTKSTSAPRVVGCSSAGQRPGFELSNLLPADCERLANLIQRVGEAVAQAEMEFNDFAESRQWSPSNALWMWTCNRRLSTSVVGCGSRRSGDRWPASRPVGPRSSHRAKRPSVATGARWPSLRPTIPPPGPFRPPSLRMAGVQEPFAGVANGTEPSDDVIGHADRPSLLAHGSADRLPNPPRGVGAEFAAPRGLKLVDHHNSPMFPSWTRSRMPNPQRRYFPRHGHHQPQVSHAELLASRVVGVPRLRSGRAARRAWKGLPGPAASTTRVRCGGSWHTPCGWSWPVDRP